MMNNLIKLKVQSPGTIMMRINVRTLTKIINNDASLANAVKDVIYKSTEDRVIAALQ